MKILSKGFMKIIIAVLLITLIIFTGIIIHNKDANATEKAKIYTSIKIKDGDTLWDIAKSNCVDGVNEKDYMEEICQINGIKNKSYLTSGSYLTIYYYK